MNTYTNVQKEPFDFKKLREACERMNALCRETDAKMDAIMTGACSVCGRKYIKLGQAHYQVCQHVYDALREQCEEKVGPLDLIFGIRISKD